MGPLIHRGTCCTGSTAACARAPNRKHNRESGGREMQPNYDRYKSLKVDWPHPRVIRITLTSQMKLGVMDPDMHRELSEVWRYVDADETVSAIIITGQGKTFSAGGDLKHELKVAVDYDLRMQAMKETRDLVYNMLHCSKPIVSGIRGWAVGAGLAAGLLADGANAGNGA